MSMLSHRSSILQYSVYVLNITDTYSVWHMWKANVMLIWWYLRHTPAADIGL